MKIKDLGDPLREEQRSLCQIFNSDFVEAEPDSKVGIALATLASLPLNALRHPPDGDSTGWYIWGGGTLLDEPDFFQPLHVAHLRERCPGILPYLGLEPGWRVLLGHAQRDVWYDASLLEI